MYQTIPIAIVSPEVLLKEITMSLVFTAVAHVLTVLLTSTSFTPIFNLNVNSLDQCQFPEGYSSNNYYIVYACLLYTSPSPRDATLSRMPSSA